MRRRLLLAFAAAGALAAPAAAQRAPEALFYYVDREDSWRSLQQHIAQIDILAPDVFAVDTMGVIYGELDPRVLELARRHDVKVMPLVVNRPFDDRQLHALLSDDAAVQRLVVSLVELCRRYALYGIQVDFENLNIRDRDAFTRFYRTLATALRNAGGYHTSVAVVHRPDELAGPTKYHQWLMETWRGGYDLKALAEAGDFVTVMTYSQHTRRTPPGPSASIQWVREVTDYFLRFMPPEKLSLGVPTGGMHWYTSQEDRITPELARSYSQNVSYAWGVGLLERHGARIQWSEEHQVPFGFYANGGTWEWVFLEDARSFAAKLELVTQRRLRGYSVWVLGPEDPKIWDAAGGRAPRAAAGGER
ncbi:MAG: glycosyl hydrolase [Gemmatimonadetes bacterium]|nr:glycosyl hydrolase [Gemmatimonadota bacterium]